MKKLFARLREGKDDDLAEWYYSQPNRSAALRGLVRRALTSESKPLDDAQSQVSEELIREIVREELKELLPAVRSIMDAALSNLQVAAQKAPPLHEVDEDARLGQMLDAQIDQFLGD